jgi:hypothetical protein
MKTYEEIKAEAIEEAETLQFASDLDKQFFITGYIRGYVNCYTQPTKP